VVESPKKNWRKAAKTTEKCNDRGLAKTGFITQSRQEKTLRLCALA
jgi:hypothetical protein